MCKHPAECKPVENNVIPMEEDNDEDEDDQSDAEESDSDESYYTETSSNNGDDSESDAESASGNRVTPDMVLLLMLKEKGLISEEKYTEKQEKCVDNIKSLVPMIPRSDSTDTLDYTKDLSDSEDDHQGSGSNDSTDVKDEEFSNHSAKDKGSGKASNEVENHKEIETVATEMQKDIEMVENESDVKDCDVCKVDEDDTNGSQDNSSKQQSKEETMQRRQELGEDNEEIEKFQQEAIMENNEMECNEVIGTLQQQQVIIEINQKRSNLETQQQAAICDYLALSEKAIDEADEESKRSRAKTAILECISQKSPRAVIENLKQGPDINNILSKNDAKPGETNIEKNNNADPEKTKQNIELSKKLNIKEESNIKLKYKKESNATNKETRSFRYILRKLVREKRITEEEDELISDEYGEGYEAVLKTYVEELDDFYDDNNDVELFNVENDSLVAFALFLNFYSPSSYKYVTETFNTPLPDRTVLCSWYLKDDEDPGISKRALEIVKQKAAGKRLPCVLMFGDIFLKNHGGDYDQVDYGGGCNFSFTDKAVMVYVFLLVSLDEDWKIPIGYIFTRNISAETQGELIRICLTLCHDAGADVVAVSLETPTPAEFLGCSFQDLKNLKTTFKHPVSDKEVAVWIDPCLALKSARHTLRYKGVLRDDAGDKIRWNLIRKLRKLRYDDDEVDLGEDSLKLRHHVAKIGLTMEVFSKSLGPALKIAEKVFPDYFRDTAPTRTFIKIINWLHDVFNTKIITDLKHLEERLDPAADYLLGFFRNGDNELSRFDRENHTPDKKKFKYGYRHLVDGQPVCCFIAFLICIESLKHIYTALVERGTIWLNPQRLCRVQFEDFVTNLRAYCWCDPDYFSGHGFQRFYNHIFDVIEKNSLSHKKLSFEYWPLRNRYHPAVTIKLTSGKRYYDDIYSAQYRLKRLPESSHEERATKMVREYSRAMDSEKDLASRKNMVGYLAGWIAGKFACRLKCEACVDALQTDRKLWFHKFITSKDIRGLCLPSEELFRICWECERALKLQSSVPRLTAWVLRRLQTRFPWADRRARHHPQHYIHLVRAVIAKYIPLRILVPFSSKDRKKVIDKFEMFSCMTPSELEEELDGVVDEFEED